jgi:gentisate 1,2-dioxygenase
MAGTPDITLDELSELYRDLERQHLVSLWASVSRLLPREPQPQAISTSGAGPILPR